ncbi:cobalt-precorrin-7 (C(5))-methyltransferase [Methanimicrococcus blatticola]|uniref:Precorrin-6Y C5,15-methyltransferase (Decarboxylating) n=1 Tax=Methanimicrococcus blatticola TaxID=91560 RepID=A0A484F6E3_9EURY|nr:cobalt-precorrin-7 (C(5))-methyltransferase [Methanimicrococcus blatticola]MBZ3934935.1 cobalt-precorrin-7 (C(5))-methyltransferase [Methanimicrococcus blatticola]MCC2508966.1 cobalt-precorrin-7 (C(5))-methyltransferase [Methanimicrococcus blatticola]TDQ71003.1 precorrin-6Y C5,15-methyltransferase (decarboxylating) [Methanimicrococcus blatticola]
MIVVGVGVGPKMLTAEGIEAIQKASVVYGSGRALELAKPYIPENTPIDTIKDYKNIHFLPADAVILSTGDPMFSGLGKFATDNDIVIPGISSFQVACARLKVNLTNFSCVTAHGRKEIDSAKDELIREIRLGKNVFLLPDEKFGASEVCEVLKEFSVKADVYSLEELGYPEEKILKGDVLNPPKPESDLYGLMIVLK